MREQGVDGLLISPPPRPPPGDMRWEGGREGGRRGMALMMEISSSPYLPFIS